MGGGGVDVPQLSSPARGTLHKRRASASPQKFNTGQFEPLTIRTDLQVPDHERPRKRAKTEKNIEIYYDAAGTPQIKETPASIAAGLSPTSAIFSPAATGYQPYTPAYRSFLTSQLLNGQLHTPPPESKPKKRFSLLDAFIGDQAMCLLLVSYLNIPSLVSLYAISKKFHWIFNKNATAFVLSSMRSLAPNADMIYPWRCYQSLCIKDPVKKQKAKPDTVMGADLDRLRELSRDVPSLRWLQMVVYREGVVNDMCIQLATRALLTPSGTRDAIKRMWFILDLPLNAHRLALIRSDSYIPNKVLYLATHFFLKVDMAFTDPCHSFYPANHTNQTLYPNRWAHGIETGCNFREKLISERSLTPLWRVLRGWTWDPEAPPRPMSNLDTFKFWLRHQFLPPDIPDELKGHLVFGMEIGEVPLVGYERIYRPENDPNLTDDQKQKLTASLTLPRPRKLLRPDELVVGECTRRELKQQTWWIDMMLWGFVTSERKNVPVRTEDELKEILKIDSEGISKLIKPPKFNLAKAMEDAEKESETQPQKVLAIAAKQDG